MWRSNATVECSADFHTGLRISNSLLANRFTIKMGFLGAAGRPWPVGGCYCGRSDDGRQAGDWGVQWGREGVKISADPPECNRPVREQDPVFASSPVSACWCSAGI